MSNVQACMYDLRILAILGEITFSLLDYRNKIRTVACQYLGISAIWHFSISHSSKFASAITACGYSIAPSSFISCPPHLRDRSPPRVAGRHRLLVAVADWLLTCCTTRCSARWLMTSSNALCVWRHDKLLLRVPTCWRYCGTAHVRALYASSSLFQRRQYKSMGDGEISTSHTTETRKPVVNICRSRLRPRDRLLQRWVACFFGGVMSRY